MGPDHGKMKNGPLLFFIACRPRDFGKEQNKGIGYIILFFLSRKRLFAGITFIGKVKDQFIPKQLLPPASLSKDEMAFPTFCCDY